jgi:hypothetical protein
MSKRQISSPTRTTDAKRRRVAAGPWFSKQAPALAAMQPADILMKHGTFKFAPRNRDAFLNEWTETPGGPIYEVILPDQPARFYLDIESVAPGAEPPRTEVQAWLRGLIVVVVTALEESGVETVDATHVLVTNDSRPSEHGCWKRSFHLTWPAVVFQNNHTAMKSFIAEHIMPKVRRDPKLRWTAEYKNGPTIKYAVDDAVYSRYRAWRVTYASKSGTTALTPWNVEDWCALELGEGDRHEFIENTLCSQACTEDVSVICSPGPISTFLEMKDDAPQTPPPPPVPAGSAEQRRFVQAALAMLSPQRCTGYEDWMKVGFAVGTVFDKDQVGRDVFRAWSQQAASYDQGACDKLYSAGGQKIGIGAIIAWLKEDAPSTVARALIQTLCADEPAEEARSKDEKRKPTKLNESKIHEWIHAHNITVRGLAAGNGQNRGGAWGDGERARGFPA